MTFKVEVGREVLVSITRADAQAVSADVKAAVSAVLDKHGMRLGEVRTTYGDAYSFKFSASRVELGADGFDYGTPEAQEWLLYGKARGIEDPKAVLGRKFHANGDEYVFMGYRSRSPKYAVQAKRVADGKSFRFTEHVLSRLV